MCSQVNCCVVYIGQVYSIPEFGDFMHVYWILTSSALKRTFFTGPKQLNDVPNVSPKSTSPCYLLVNNQLWFGGQF